MVVFMFPALRLAMQFQNKNIVEKTWKRRKSEINLLSLLDEC